MVPLLFNFLSKLPQGGINVHQKTTHRCLLNQVLSGKYFCISPCVVILPCNFPVRDCSVAKPFFLQKIKIFCTFYRIFNLDFGLQRIWDLVIICRFSVWGCLQPLAKKGFYGQQFRVALQAPVVNILVGQGKPAKGGSNDASKEGPARGAQKNTFTYHKPTTSMG